MSWAWKNIGKWKITLCVSHFLKWNISPSNLTDVINMFALAIKYILRLIFSHNLCILSDFSHLINHTERIIFSTQTTWINININLSKDIFDACYYIVSSLFDSSFSTTISLINERISLAQFMQVFNKYWLHFYYLKWVIYDIEVVTVCCFQFIHSQKKGIVSCLREHLHNNY